MTKNIGVDIGFGFVKVTDEENNIVFPSVIGEGRNIRYNTGINNGKKLDNLQLEIDNSKYFVGNLASRQSEMILSTLSQDRIGSLENKALFATALGLLCSPQDRINIVTGLPVSEYSEDLKQKLINQLSGIHEFKLNDKTYIINVENIKVIPQPLGAIFNELLTQNGKILNPQYSNLKIGIIDIGFRTSDFAVTDNLEYVDRLSSTTETALSNAFKYIARTLNESHEINIPVYKIQKIAEKKSFNYKNNKYDLSTLIKKAYKITANNIVSEVQSLWKMWEIDEIILTGGGSSVLYNYIINKLNHGTLSRNAQLSNVQGFLKMANREW